jgi:hypothetical protein
VQYSPSCLSSKYSPLHPDPVKYVKHLTEACPTCCAVNTYMRFTLPNFGLFLKLSSVLGRLITRKHFLALRVRLSVCT